MFIIILKIMCMFDFASMEQRIHVMTVQGSGIIDHVCVVYLQGINWGIVNTSCFLDTMKT